MSKGDKPARMTLDFSLELSESDNDKIRSDALRKVKDAINDKLHAAFIKENKHFEIQNGLMRERINKVVEAFLDSEHVDRYIETSLKRNFEAVADEAIVEMLKRGIKKRAVSKIQGS